MRYKALIASLKMPKFKLNVKALVLASAMLVLSYLFSNFSTSMTGEPDILQAVELFKDYFDLGSPETSSPDSILFVNVSYDRELIPYDDGLNRGNIDITDRAKLIKFLKIVKNSDCRYIILDIAYDKELLKNEPLNDSLYNILSEIPNLALSKSEAFVVDERLQPKGGLVDYCTSVFEETFTKVPVIEDGEVSLPMKVFEELQSKHIEAHSNLFYTIDGKLARRCIYPKMYVNNRNLAYLNLGNDILNEGGNSGYTSNDLKTLLKDKIIVVGAISGPLDVHNTYIGNLSGAVINTNTYISLCKGAYKIPIWLLAIQFLIFYACGVFIFSDDKEKEKKKNKPLVLLWAYYSVVLTILVVLIYVLTGEAYDILFTATTLTMIHWIIKTKRNMRPKKFLLLISIICGFVFSANAQKYVIIKINDNQPLLYGNGYVAKGDTIVDTSKLQIGKNQIVQLKDLRTQLPLYPIKGEKYVARNCTSLKQYLFPKHQGATRGTPGDCLKDIVGDELEWIDNMMMMTYYTPDREGMRHFIMEIEGQDGIRFLYGVTNNTAIVFSKEQIFGPKEPHELYFNLWIGNGSINEYKENSECVLEHVKLVPIEY